MSKVDVNVVGGAVPFSTGKGTTTGSVKNANSVFKSHKSGVATQSEIRPDNSYTSYIATWNKNSVFFDGYSQAKGVRNRLTSNIKKTAENFLSHDLQEKIRAKFKTQLESLSKCYKALAEGVKRFDTLQDDEKIALEKALAGINGLVYRLNNESVGGINKLEANQFQKSTMSLIADADAYEEAKAMVESEEPSSRERGKAIMKKYEGKAFLSKDVAKKNLNALNKNLELLKKFSKSPSADRSDTEKMLNFIQQCALNAWVFNDIAKSLKSMKFSGSNRFLNFSDMALEKMGILSKENKEMRKLNDAARNTTMFKEFQINELIEKAKLTENPSLNEKAKPTENPSLNEKAKLTGNPSLNEKAKLTGNPSLNEESVKKFLERWGSEKIGFRGRHGVDKNDKRVSSKPIGNTKKGKEVLQSGSLFKDKEFTSSAGNIVAIKGSIVPNETANLKTVPSEMLEDLEGILDTDTGKKIVELLQNEKLIEAEKDSSGKFSKITAKPSFASFINDAGLPTYCSVSGTTGEIVSVLHCTLKDEDGSSPLTDVFRNLLKIAEGQQPEPPNFNFSTYFAPVATFMEVGHFHTTGEVLGGFYSVAVAERNVSGSEEKIDTTEPGFRNLLEYFNNNQRDFLGSSLSRETLSRIASSSKTSQI